MRLLPVDTISRNAVGRTGFEPVTSPVSGNFRDGSGCLPPSGWVERGALTWANILGGSGWVWGRLTALASSAGLDALGSAGRARSSGRGGAPRPVRSSLLTDERICFQIVPTRLRQGARHGADGEAARGPATGPSLSGAVIREAGKAWEEGAGGDVRSCAWGRCWVRGGTDERASEPTAQPSGSRACGRPQDRPGRTRPVS